MPVQIASFRSRFPRILGMNTFDLGGTIAGVWLVRKLGINSNVSFSKSLLHAIILGEVIHLIFRIDTPITRLVSRTR